MLGLDSAPPQLRAGRFVHVLAWPHSGGHLLTSRCLTDLLLPVLLLCLVFLIDLCLLLVLGVFFVIAQLESIIGAVSSVASLAVGAMQRQREGNLSVAKLTWTDAGRPAGNV